MAEERALADLAASVADGAPVDWEAVEARTSGRQRRLARHLRLVESVAALYRSLPSEHEDVMLPGAGPDRPAEEPAGRAWGHLVLRDRIGAGSSCEVFKAWDSELHREVALKLLLEGAGSRDARARMLDEARRLARLRHRNIVQVYGAEEHDGRVGLWMELVEGDPLDRIVQQRGHFGAREAALVGLDLCAALAAVHGAGLLHRDLKAQNVMRERGGRIVLMDFGTGEELRQNVGSRRMTGTPLYLAPEIFKGRPASVQSDVYSLGVLLFYLTSGEFPVRAASMQELARAQVRGERRHLRDLRPDLPEAFVSVVERALEPDPARRYRTAGELESALRGTLDAEVRATTPARAPARWSARAAFAVAAAVLLAAVAGLIAWAVPRAGARASGTEPIDSIAVLPFVDLSGPGSPPYLADALTDQLIAVLGQVGSLRVTPRASVMAFKERRPSTAEIADALGVDALLDSTVLMAGAAAGEPPRYRVNATLIDARSDTIIWSRSFERSAGDAFVLQADVAQSIARALHAAVAPKEADRLNRVSQTTPAAEQAYFQGLYHLRQLSRSSATRAVEAFTRATELDSGHAAAYAALGRSYLVLGTVGGIQLPEARALAHAAATRAVELSANESEAHAVLADLEFYYNWDWPQAETAYLRALSLNPNDTYARLQYASYLSAMDRLDEALAEARRAVESDPLSADAARVLAIVHFYRRDFQTALEVMQEAVDRDPSAAGNQIMLSRIHQAAGDIPEAIAAAERALALVGQDAPRWRAHLLSLQAAGGGAGNVTAMLEDLIRSASERNQRLSPAQIAYVQLRLGDRAAALDLLERAAAERDPDLLWLRVDPRVDALRAEPRFRQLLDRIGLS